MKTFWQALLAAAIGGAVTGLAAGLTESKPTPGKIGISAGAGAAVAVAALFKSSPTNPPNNN